MKTVGPEITVTFNMPAALYDLIKDAANQKKKEPNGVFLDAMYMYLLGDAANRDRKDDMRGTKTVFV